MKTRSFSLILASIAILTIASGCYSAAGDTDLDSYFGPSAPVVFNTTDPPEADEPETSETVTAASDSKAGAAETAVSAAAAETSATVITSATTAATAKATTTTSAEASAPTANPPATVKGINNGTFAKYDALCEKYKPASDMSCYLFNFNRSISTGFGIDGTVLPTEAEYGVKAVVNDRKITFTVYDHTGSMSVADMYFQALDASRSNEKIAIEGTAKFSIDTSPFTNGLYRIIVKFTNNNESSIYIYINGNETWLCQQESASEASEKIQETRRADLVTVLKNGNVTPENSLSLDKVWYPFKAQNEGERCDTQLWIDLSGTFINDGWSDEHKLYAIQAWVRENLAYDNYVSDVTHISRAQYYSDLSGAQSVYNLRAGVCFDYANIITIMCRANDIPAVTIGTKSIKHVWNAVYVNNRWIEYDAVMSNQYNVERDTSVRNKTGNPIYGGIYSLNINNTETGKMPSDAEANKYFQYDSLYLY